MFTQTLELSLWEWTSVPKMTRNSWSSKMPLIEKLEEFSVISMEILKNGDCNRETGDEAVKTSITPRLTRKMMPKPKCLMMR